jgi:hypothetical protein
MKGAAPDRPAQTGRHARLLVLISLGVLALACAAAFAANGHAREARLDRDVIRAASRSYGRTGALERAPRLWNRPFAARPRVGLQVGHWRMEELPDELWRLRDNTGAQSGPYREVDANLAVAQRTAAILRAAGVEVDLLPGTIPPDYLADAVVAIHADGAWREGARGWKISTAWRASDASRLLERAIALYYPQVTGLPEDKVGITYGMKGYYAFSRGRFRHAVSPFTPAVILEMGFVTDSRDRAVIVDRPNEAAAGIAQGVLTFLSTHASLDWKKLVPRTYPLEQIGGVITEVYAYPEPDSPVRDVLVPGTQVFPVHKQSGWVEIIVRGNFRSFGWVRESQLAPMS